MGASRTWHAVLGLLLTVSALAAPSATITSAAGPYDEAVDRAITLLPRRPERILVVDASRAIPPVDAHGRQVEAFVTHGDRTVYLVAQGDMLQHALEGPSIFDYAVAATIWHEMAHVDGADEPAAQRAEEGLWKAYVLQHRVDNVKGLKYLALLQQRR